MNTILTNFDFFIDHDINPFLIFDDKGKIKYSNRSADLILKTSTSKQLYEIALTYAPKTYGSKKTMTDINLYTYEFYCINAIYKNPMEIGLYLYHKPIANTKNKLSFQDFHKTDINILLKAHIELFKINSNAKIKLLTDTDIPEFLAHQNNIALLLRKNFDKFKKSRSIDITLKIKTSEKIIIENKAYNIAILKISSDDTIDNNEDTKEINIAKENYIKIQKEENSTIIEIPLIKG